MTPNKVFMTVTSEIFFAIALKAIQAGDEEVKK
jgi:hypothetical protein